MAIIHRLYYNLWIISPKLKESTFAFQPPRRQHQKRFWLIIHGLWPQKSADYYLYTTSFKPHRVLCETKDHLHRNVTPIFNYWCLEDKACFKNRQFGQSESQWMSTWDVVTSHTWRRVFADTNNLWLTVYLLCTLACINTFKTVLCFVQIVTWHFGL